MEKELQIHEQWEFDDFLTALSNAEETDSFTVDIFPNKKESFILRIPVATRATVYLKSTPNQPGVINATENGKLVFMNDVSISGVRFISEGNLRITNANLIEAYGDIASFDNVEFNVGSGIQCVVATGCTSVSMTYCDAKLNMHGDPRAVRLLVADKVQFMYFYGCTVISGENVVDVIPFKKETSDGIVERAADIYIGHSTITDSSMPIYVRRVDGITVPFEIKIEDCGINMKENTQNVIRTNVPTNISIVDSRIDYKSAQNALLVATTEGTDLGIDLGNSRLNASVVSDVRGTLNAKIDDCHIDTINGQSDIPIIEGLDDTSRVYIHANYIKCSQIVSGTFASVGISANSISMGDTDHDYSSPITAPILDFTANELGVTRNSNILLSSDKALVFNNWVVTSMCEDPNPIIVAGEGYSWNLNMLNGGEYLVKQA